VSGVIRKSEPVSRSGRAGSRSLPLPLPLAVNFNPRRAFDGAGLASIIPYGLYPSPSFERGLSDQRWTKVHGSKLTSLGRADIKFP